LDKLINKLINGDKRSVARAITIIENNQQPEKKQLIKLLYPYTGKAKIIGITGPPGAGKSTLVDGLLYHIRKQQLTVGIIAIDPSSPYSGGAILGDRIRMQHHALDPGVFIRSMGNRGELGGLAKATEETVKVLDAMGNDLIIVETVGVGQSELEIMNTADTTVVVLHPSTGDSIQTAKAGIMEIADIFVINKSDLQGAEKMAYELEMLIGRTSSTVGWQKKLVKTIGTEKQGIDQLWESIREHQQFLASSELFQKKRAGSLHRDFKSYLHELFQLQVDKHLKQAYPNQADLVQEMSRKGSWQVAEEIYDKLLKPQIKEKAD